jgi:hypothetical protein
MTRSNAQAGTEAPKKRPGRPKGTTKAKGAGKGKVSRMRAEAKADLKARAAEVETTIPLPAIWHERGERAERLDEAEPLEGEVFGPGGGDWSEAEEGEYFARGRGTRGPAPLLKVSTRVFEAIWRAGLIDCTEEETAARLGVSHSTWQRFAREHPMARQCFADAKLVGNSLIRQALYEQAREGGFALSHVARYRLGQTDKVGITDAKTLVRETISEVGAALREKALARLGQSEESELPPVADG